MKQGSHRGIKAPKVKLQILRIFFLAILIPILVLGIFSILHVRNQMAEHYDSQVKADGLRVNSILFDITTSIYTSSESIAGNKRNLALFGSEYTDVSDKQDYLELCEELSSFTKSTASISSLHIYTTNPNIPVNSFISTISDNPDEEWYQKIGTHWATWTTLSKTDSLGKEHYELALIRRLGIVSKDYRAYLVINLDNNYLKNRIEQNRYPVIACVDNGPAFYASNTSLWQKKMPFPDDFEGSFYKYTGSLSVDGKESLSNIISFRPYKTDNMFYICVHDSSAYASINRMTGLYLFIILIATLVPSCIIFVFSSYFSNRITTLKTAMHQARMGDYNIIDHFKGDDELSETFTDLKATVEKIHEKEARYYEAQLTEQQLINRQQQMEFEMLASQINPHFLYNTLETIRMQALANGNRDVATSIKLLGKSMHYVLENTGTSSTTLAKELDYIKTYLAIQNLRFGDRVNATLTVQEGLDTDNLKMLPLLLQPIVENAIVHGLESVEQNGHILIDVSTSGSDLVITIKDNGPGMDETTLENLKQHIANHDPHDTRSIGLYNINQRIHLLYGENYGLDITSSPGVGTTVTLCIPQTYQQI